MLVKFHYKTAVVELRSRNKKPGVCQVFCFIGFTLFALCLCISLIIRSHLVMIEPYFFSCSHSQPRM